MYPEDEESKTIPLQSVDNGNTPVENPSQAPNDAVSNTNMYQAQNTQPYQQTMNQGYNAAPQQNMNQNYNAAPQQGMTQGFNTYQQPAQNYTAPNQGMYQYQAQSNQPYQQTMNQGYNAAPQQNMNQGYNTAPQQGMAQGFNAYQQPNPGYAQQNYQNPYYVNPAGAGMNGTVPKKKKSKLVFIIPIAIVLIAAIIIAVVLLLKGKGSPKETVVNAMSKTFSQESPSALSAYLGFEELNTMLESGSYEQALTLSINDLSGYSMPYDAYLLEGLGISANVALDMENEQMSGDFSITYGGISYLDYIIYAYNDYMAFAFPSLFDGYIEFQTTNFAEDFNNSYIASALGSDYQIPSEMTFDFFEQLKSSAASGDAAVPEEVHEFLESIQFEKADSQNIDINGKSQSCQGYHVTVPADSIKDLAKWFCSYASENDVDISYSDIESVIPKKDIVFTVYVDKNGRMVRISYQDSFNVEGTTLDVNGEISFLGTDRPTDNVTGKIDFTAEGTTMTLVIDSKTTNSGSSSVTNSTVGLNMAGMSLGGFNYYSSLDTASGAYAISMDLTVMNETYFKLTMDGAYSNVVAGKSYTCSIDDLTIDLMDGEYIVSLSGSLSCAPLSGSAEQPSGHAYNLFTMTEADFAAISEEMSENLLNGPIGQLMMELYSSYDSYSDDYYSDDYYSDDWYDDDYYSDDWYYDDYYSDDWYYDDYEW